MVDMLSKYVKIKIIKNRLVKSRNLIAGIDLRFNEVENRTSVTLEFFALEHTLLSERRTRPSLSGFLISKKLPEYKPFYFLSFKLDYILFSGKKR